MRTREEAIDDMILALMYLTRFNDGEGRPFNELAWKNYDFDAIDRLDNEDFIINPKNRCGGGYKYAYLTEKGRERARRMLSELEVKEPGLYERFDFCEINPELTEEVIKIEQLCFSPNEACSPEHMKERIKVASDLFLVARDKENNGKIAGFLNGIATNERKFRDEFFTDESLHDPEGSTVMILGLDVLPEYRKMGLARELVFNYCRKEEERGRKRLVLTCHKEKIKMYRKFGFDDLGESASNWGGEKWHEMEIRLNF